MPRIQVPITVVDASGNAVAGASVTLKKRADGTAATVYPNETTPTPEGSNTVATDSLGRVNYWVDTGRGYSADISGTGISPYTIAFDAPAPTPAPVSKPNGISLGGLVLLPSNNTNDIGVAPGFFIDPAPNETVYLYRVRYKIHSGTSATFKIQRNGVDVTGWTGLAAGTAAAVNTLASPVACAAGDYIQLIVTALSGSPYSLAATITTHHYPGF